MNEKIKERLTERMKAEGLCQVGFCRLPKCAPGLDGLDCAVSLVFRLSDRVVDGIESAPTYSYFQHYRAANALLDRCALICGEMIAREGYDYFPVAASQSVHDQEDKYTGVFQHKTAAALSGLGFIGRSALFISYDYGARVRLATVLTNMPLAPEEPVSLPENPCGSCRACVEICPAGAITGNAFDKDKPREYIFDAEACSKHMKKAYQHIGRGAVCGLCMRVCPQNRRRTNK